MLLVDPAGNVLAVNGKDTAAGRSATAPFYAVDFAGGAVAQARLLTDDDRRAPWG